MKKFNKFRSFSVIFAFDFQSVSKKVTHAEPFSFCDRDAATMERKQTKIAAILDEERKQREFKAKPVNIFSFKSFPTQIQSNFTGAEKTEDFLE